MFHNRLKPLCLIGLAGLSVLSAPAWAQSASIQQLVSQGNYWQDQGREDLAADTWRKLLATDANQPDALLGLGLIDINQGRRADAQRRLQLLQARHPSAPQTTRLRLALGGSSSSGGTNPLQAARRAAAAGRYAEAVRAYDQAFGGSGPTDDVALEYYQVLAGTPEGWARARDGLRALVARADSPSARLALAQVLTYREPSRREGIAQLSTLAQRQDTAGPARSAWRQALLWLNATTADAPLYTSFLAVQPNDREVAAKQAQLREQAAAPAADPNERLLGEGFRALENNQLAQAEARFAQVLRARPRDAQALGGLGSVRLRQERFEEANELLRQAVARDGKWRQAANAARYWTLVTQAQKQSGSQAIASLREAVALLPKEPAGLVALAQLQETSDPAAAEKGYRAALELDAGNAGALQGLVGLLGRQGRAEEAAVLFERMTPAQRERAGGESALRANVARARAQEALASGSLQMAQIELEGALLAQPRDPWLRLETARLYQRMGRTAEADRVMADLRELDDSSVASLHAQALYAQERGQWPQVQALLERIPETARDPAIAALRNQAWVEGQVAQARTLFQQARAGEAQLLLARTEATLGAQPRDPQAIVALARGYAETGGQQRAMVLARQLLEGNETNADAQLMYAGIALRGGRDGEVASLLRQLGQAQLTPAQQAQLQTLRGGYVLRQVDALREQGNLEGAYAVLAPALAERPDDPGNIAALARLYSAAGDHGQALALYQQQLLRAPGDTDALVAAAGSAAALRDMDSAEAYLEQALAQAPQSPDVLAAAGRVYRAAGKNRRAESYFKASLAAAARQSGYHDNGLPTAPGARLAGGAGAFNPFAGMNRGQPSRALRSSAQPLPAAMMLDSGTASSVPTTTVPAGAYAAAPMGPLFDADGLPAPVSEAGFAPAALPVPGTGASRRVRAERGADVASQGVLGELRDLRAENSSSLSVGAGFRSRDGEAGLGAVDDLQVPMEGRFAVGDGKLIVAVTPTILDAGRAKDEYATTSRFGGGPQAALAGALAADRTPVDSLVGSSLYQTLLTNGASNATRNLLEQRALDNGRYQELYNQTDGALTAAERRAQALQLVFADPLPAFVLSRDLANTPISDIARQVLGNANLARGLTAAEQAQLQALASGGSAGQSPLAFQDTLYSMVANAAGARRMSPQDATGVGVAVGYQRGGFAVDVGTSPLGFDENQVVGGVGYQGRIGESFNYSGEASRRAVTDSVLSFAGVDDARTGMRWGGVTATGAKLGGTLDNGLIGGYASLSWHRLEGENVASNERQELGVGVYVHALETEDQSLTAGLNVTALQYDRNLSGFTYGHGGYFSPQRYVDVGFPVHWNGRNTRAGLTWQVDASVGVQHFEEKPADYFPTSAAMQQAAYDAASMAALLGLVPEYVDPVYTGQTKTGVSYNLSAAAEWQLSNQLFLGGRMEFNNARDYRQFGTSLYLRFLLDRLGAGLGKAPQVLQSPFASGL